MDLLRITTIDTSVHELAVDADEDLVDDGGGRHNANTWQASVYFKTELMLPTDSSVAKSIASAFNVLNSMSATYFTDPTAKMGTQLLAAPK